MLIKFSFHLKKLHTHSHTHTTKLKFLITYKHKRNKKLFFILNFSSASLLMAPPNQLCNFKVVRIVNNSKINTNNYESGLVISFSKKKEIFTTFIITEIYSNKNRRKLRKRCCKSLQFQQKF